jgi:hypothetical protein
MAPFEWYKAICETEYGKDMQSHKANVKRISELEKLLAAQNSI